MKKRIRNISIIANLNKQEAKEVVAAVLQEGRKYNLKFLLTKEIARVINKKEFAVSNRIFFNNCDMVLVIGGDGTFINAAYNFAKKDVPLLGIHIGGLGFLTEIKVSEIPETIKNIASGKFKIEERLMLEAKIVRNNRIVKTVTGLNEIVVHKGDFTRIVKLKSYINKQYIGSFEGDGIIVATPTGSTGYSLSAAGPIVVPGMRVFIINTICPHTFGFRPIIVPSTSTIEIKIDTQYKELILSVDGIKASKLKPNDTIRITESKYTTKLIKSPKRSFFDILREKFEWVK